MREVLRFVVGGCAVLALAAGCGGGRTDNATPITSVDQPVPAALAHAFGSSGSAAACVDLVSGAMSDCHGPQSSLSRKARPRLLAALSLSWPRLPGYEGLFVLFRTGQGSACFDVQIARRDGTGAGPLKCLGNARCGPVCLTAVSRDGRSLLGGTVAPDAKEIRLIYPGAKPLSYRLDGPIAAALAGRRIFMVDIGRGRAPVREELVR